MLEGRDDRTGPGGCDSVRHGPRRKQQPNGGETPCSTSLRTSRLPLAIDGSGPGEPVAAYRVVIAVGNPLQVVDLVDLVADGGEGLGDGGEDGFAAAMRSVGEPVDGIGRDQRDELGDVVAVGGLLVGADELSERGSRLGHGMALFSLSRRDK